jgi:hypothetical protein
MAQGASNYKGIYLYAAVGASTTQGYGSIGIDEGKVYSITEGHVSAIASDITAKKIRPERRHLAAHQGVLKRLMEDTTPLPVSFGVIADSPDAIKKILSRNQEVFLKELRRVEGRIEMGIRVTWDVSNIFEYFIEIHPELRSARDQFFGTYGEPTHEDKLELGRMFDHFLNEDRENCTGKVEEVLSGYCFEIKRNNCRSEREVMNLACLVGRNADQEFEKGVLEAAGLFDHSFVFDYNGPWAPHNFVDMELDV